MEVVKVFVQSIARSEDGKKTFIHDAEETLYIGWSNRLKGIKAGDNILVAGEWKTSLKGNPYFNIDHTVTEEAKSESEVVWTEPSGEERGMWWKEAGEFIRMPKEQALEICKVDLLKALRTAYFTHMFTVLDIKVADKKEQETLTTE